MFGIGFFELVLIAVAVLVFVGPQKLPDVMRQAGKLFVQLRRTANDVRGTFDQVLRDAEDDLRREEQAALKELLAAKAAVTNTVTTTATALPDASMAAPHPDSPADSHAMAHHGEPHVPDASLHTIDAPHPADPPAVSHHATEPAPAPHATGTELAANPPAVSGEPR